MFLPRESESFKGNFNILFPLPDAVCFIGNKYNSLLCLPSYLKVECGVGLYWAFPSGVVASLIQEA